MIREPVVSGRFYPDESSELIDLMKDCEHHQLGVRQETVTANGRLLGLILPHAGYVFSGPVATWGMRRLSLEQPLPEILLLLGPKHTPYGAKAAISAADGWRTPLGTVPVHAELRQALLKTGAFEADNQAHAQEHSLEVQIPFLQKLYGKTPFSVVPIAMQYASLEECQAWGRAIQQVLADKVWAQVRVLVSSDFSHDTPREKAYRIDSQALDVIESGNPDAFYNLVIDEDRSICGVIPITVFMSALQGRNVLARRLKYATSMDVMEHPRGVGYAAVAFEEAGE